MSSSDASPSSSSSDARQFDRWRKNLSWATGLGLNPEEQQIRQRDLDRKLDESLLRRCEKMKLGLVETSPAVVFMLKHLRLSGCAVSPQHIQCASCNATTSGGFSPDSGGILICTRGFTNRKHMENTIVHELVHMYDHCKFKVDWSNLRHHACSEVRAASLSGDCRWGREINRFFFTFSKQHQVCARRRAILSVSANPNCPDTATAERAVNEVWESCFSDTRPFDEIY
ncbi:metalloprotease ATP23 [Gautieria morchelliformis]|nr:metalloprotease ATP23 [Gautieria morchelliformis]